MKVHLVTEVLAEILVDRGQGGCMIAFEVVSLASENLGNTRCNAFLIAKVIVIPLFVTEIILK